MRRPIILVSPCRSTTTYYGSLYDKAVVSIDYNTGYMTRSGAVPVVPDLVRDEETADELMEMADGLFINRTCYDRLAQALGGEPKEILIGRGSEFVCITDGENGAVCRTREGEYSTPALPIGEVLDGTGAGDGFAGTFLAGRLMGMDHERCLKRAAAAGAYACTVMGGQGGCCSPEELNAFAERYGWEV